MNKLVSLRTCAGMLGVHPVQLSRWLRKYLDVLKVHKISSRAYAMKPAAIKKGLILLGKLPETTQKIA